MLKQYTAGLALLASLFLFTGCGAEKEPSAPSESATPNAEEPKTDAPALDVESETTPEGVTQHFFAAFFSGQDEAAWELLTVKAQDATRENFSAQASDTIEWKVKSKKIENGIAYVFVEVSDLNDEGERAKEELTFALRNDSKRWGVAGFSAGELAVDFEAKMIGSLDENGSENVGGENVGDSELNRVSQVPTENKVQ